MYILADAITPHGAPATTHRIKSVEITDAVRVYVNSFTSPENDLLVWQDAHEMPLSALATGTYPECVYTWLVSETGPFSTGHIVTDSTTDLDIKKAKLIIEIKAKRDNLLAGGCTTPSGVVDTDGTSLINLMTNYQAAMFASLSSASFSISWRMKDNSMVDLDAPAMIAIGNAVLQRNEAIYSKSWEIKAALEAADADTIDSVDITGWPE